MQVAPTSWNTAVTLCPTCKPSERNTRRLGEWPRVDLAVEELERVIRQGARVINLRPGHAYGRSAGDPYFDPFWSRVNEARISVLFHQGEGGHNAALATLGDAGELDAMIRDSATAPRGPG